MNRLQRAATVARDQTRRGRRRQGFIRQFVQHPVDETAQDTLGNAFRRRINRCDPAKMNRDLVVRLHDLEFGVIQANTFAAQPGFPKDHQLLPGGDHFLDVVQIEPAADQRLAQGIGIGLLQSDFEDFLPAAKSPELRIDHFAAKADRRFAFLAREPGEFLPVFITPRVMGQQILHGLDAQSAQSRRPRTRDPFKFLKRLGNFH